MKCCKTCLTSRGRGWVIASLITSTASKFFSNPRGNAAGAHKCRWISTKVLSDHARPPTRRDGRRAGAGVGRRVVDQISENSGRAGAGGRLWLGSGIMHGVRTGRLGVATSNWLNHTWHGMYIAALTPTYSPLCSDAPSQVVHTTQGFLHI